MRWDRTRDPLDVGDYYRRLAEDKGLLVRKGDRDGDTAGF